MEQEKYILVGVKNAKKGLRSSKTEFGTQNQYNRVEQEKIILLGVKKVKISLQNPKTEFIPQNLCDISNNRKF
jgi:hypothetical protein